MASRRSKANTRETASAEKRSRGAACALVIILATATFAAHFPALRAGYIWDDDTRVYQNPLLQSLKGLGECWTSTTLYDYWPLTRTLLWVEWQIWGNNPHLFHLVNIALQALAAVLLWRILKRLNLSDLGAFLAGLLFAIHPVTVESVAWITEQKNVLSMVLYLLSILAFLRFEDQPLRKCYVLAILAFLAALLAKSSVVAMPVVLLICAWWRRGRVTGTDWLRAAPFFVLSLMLGLVEIWFEHHNAIAGTVARPEGIASRTASVGWVTWFYLYKLVLPVNLAMIYPRWTIEGNRILSFVPLGLLIACFLVCLRYRKSWGRGPLAALASFVVVLAPVLGLVDMSYAAYSLVADHLQYPGIPGIMALMGGSIAAAISWARSKNRRELASGIAVATGIALLTLAVLTWRQARTYRDAESVWTHTLDINDRAWVAYSERGTLYDNKGMYNEALRDWARAIELRPDHPVAYSNRGAARGRRGEYDEAIQDCTNAIKLRPGYAEAYKNRGNAYDKIGAHDQAIQDYTKAIELKADYAEAYNSRGAIYGRKGMYDEAIRDWTRAIEIKPDHAVAYNNRGIAYGIKGDHERAVQDFTKAIEIKKDYVEAYRNRAMGYYILQQYDKSWADVRMCRRLGGRLSPDLLEKLAAKTGRRE